MLPVLGDSDDNNNSQIIPWLMHYINMYPHATHFMWSVAHFTCQRLQNMTATTTTSAEHDNNNNNSGSLSMPQVAEHDNNNNYGNYNNN